MTGSRTLPRPPRDATETRWRAQIRRVCAWKAGRWSPPVSESAWTVVKACSGVGGCQTHPWKCWAEGKGGGWVGERGTNLETSEAAGMCPRRGREPPVTNPRRWGSGRPLRRPRRGGAPVRAIVAGLRPTPTARYGGGRAGRNGATGSVSSPRGRRDATAHELGALSGSLRSALHSLALSERLTNARTRARTHTRTPARVYAVSDPHTNKQTEVLRRHAALLFSPIRAAAVAAVSVDGGWEASVRGGRQDDGSCPHVMLVKIRR